MGGPRGAARQHPAHAPRPTWSAPRDLDAYPYGHRFRIGYEYGFRDGYAKGYLDRLAHSDPHADPGAPLQLDADAHPAPVAALDPDALAGLVDEANTYALADTDSDPGVGLARSHARLIAAADALRRVAG